MSHLFLMTLYAAIIGAFFSVLWYRDRAKQIRLFLKIFLGLLGGAVLLGWIMMPYPAGPPSGPV